MIDILPSMPKGEIVGNMAVTKMMQSLKVVIDGNQLWQRKLDDDRAASRVGRAIQEAI